jgi:hypothetical protein
LGRNGSVFALEILFDLQPMLCWIIKKQAIDDYQGIRADPLLIRQDKEQIIAQGGNEDYIAMGGILMDRK